MRRTDDVVHEFQKIVVEIIDGHAAAAIDNECDVSASCQINKSATNATLAPPVRETSNNECNVSASCQRNKQQRMRRQRLLSEKQVNNKCDVSASCHRNNLTTNATSAPPVRETS